MRVLLSTGKAIKARRVDDTRVVPDVSIGSFAEL